MTRCDYCGRSIEATDGGISTDTLPDHVQWDRGARLCEEHFRQSDELVWNPDPDNLERLHWDYNRQRDEMGFERSKTAHIIADWDGVTATAACGVEFTSRADQGDSLPAWGDEELPSEIHSCGNCPWDQVMGDV